MNDKVKTFGVYLDMVSKARVEPLPYMTHLGA